MTEFLSENFPGLALMPNWHPLLVHFPIALLSSYLLLDIAGVAARKSQWRNVAGVLLYLGTAFTAAAVVLGLQAAQTVPHGEDVHAIMVSHGKHGFAVLGMAVLLSGWRRIGGERWTTASTALHLLAAGSMVLVMAHGADLGGLMVYGHGVGVKSAGPVQEHQHDPMHEHSHDHDHGSGAAADHHH